MSPQEFWETRRIHRYESQPRRLFPKRTSRQCSHYQWFSSDSEPPYPPFRLLQDSLQLPHCRSAGYDSISVNTWAKSVDLRFTSQQLYERSLTYVRSIGVGGVGLRRGLGSRGFAERFHGNALVTHLQDDQVFRAARRLHSHAVARCGLHQRAPQG
jgi:hypothetical protein